jgi:hypothetical protein
MVDRTVRIRVYPTPTARRPLKKSGDTHFAYPRGNGGVGWATRLLKKGSGARLRSLGYSGSRV